MKLLVKKFSPDSILPTRGSSGAAGYDLYSNETLILYPNQTAKVSSGVGIQIYDEEADYLYAGIIKDRSSLASKNLRVGAGVIDCDYNGLIKVVITNHSPTNEYLIKKGDRIAQMLIHRVYSPEVEEVGDLSVTNRGDGGFGSTGV